MRSASGPALAPRRRSRRGCLYGDDGGTFSADVDALDYSILSRRNARVTQSMNRLVVPRLREAGFAFVVDENATRWKEGSIFGA